MESYKIQQNSYSFLQEGDSRIGMQEIYSLQQRIDEYRAKFKHNDLTPFTWHFAGNKIQGWSGGTLEDKSVLAASSPVVSPISLSIDTSIYKYFSMRCLAKQNTDIQCKLEWYDGSEVLMGSKDFTIFAAGEYLVNLDLEGITGWSGTVDHIKIYCPNVYIYYIKVDKVDPMYIERNVDVDLFNQMVDKVERMAGTPNGAIKDLEAIKAKDNSRINKSQIVKLYREYLQAQPRAYNGCATCDVFTRDCYGGYGEIGCQTCNGCNQYSGCSSCNGTCYSQGHPCTCYGVAYGSASFVCRNGNQTQCACNATCHTEPTCACDQTCYRQAASKCVASCYDYACTCNNRCYSNSCTTCNSACNTESCPCNGAYGTKCTSCHTVSDAYCNYCNSRWPLSLYCSASGYQNPNDNCSLCYGYTYDCHCYQTCYQNSPCTTNTPPNSSYKTVSCTVCNSCNAQGANKCTSRYGYNEGTYCSACYGNTPCTCNARQYGYTACVCNETCYTQATCTCDGQTCDSDSPCTCNGVTYGYAQPCACDGACNGYSPCRTCNSCNGYSGCQSCDTTCYSDLCRDCHNTNYHN